MLEPKTWRRRTVNLWRIRPGLTAPVARAPPQIEGVGVSMRIKIEMANEGADYQQVRRRAMVADKVLFNGYSGPYGDPAGAVAVGIAGVGFAIAASKSKPR